MLSVILFVVQLMKVRCVTHMVMVLMVDMLGTTRKQNWNNIIGVFDCTFLLVNLNLIATTEFFSSFLMWSQAQPI